MKKVLSYLNPFETTEEIIIPPNLPRLNNISAEIGTQVNLKPNEKVKEHFNAFLKELDIPGPDYFEFRNALDASGLPDEQAIPVVHNTFKVLGISKEKLISTIDFYIQKINEEGERIKKIAKEKIDSELHAKALEIENLKQEISNLEKLISEKQTLAEKLSVEYTSDMDKISSTQKDYSVVSEQYVAKLNTDKININRLIK